MSTINGFIPMNNTFPAQAQGLGAVSNGYQGMAVGQPMYMTGANIGGNLPSQAPAYGLSTPQNYGGIPNTGMAQGYGNTGYGSAPSQGAYNTSSSYPPSAPYGGTTGGYAPQGYYGDPRQVNLNQYTKQNGSNQVATGNFNGNAYVSQFGDSAYQQSFSMNQGQGNLQLQQLGGAYGGYQSQIGGFNGSLNYFGYNNQGGNKLNYNNIYGQNNISTFSTGNNYNSVNLNNVNNGVRYLTSGNTNLDINHTPQASVMVSGDDDKASNYFIRIANSYGTKKNSVILNMDGYDQATVDLSTTFNSSEVFVNGTGRKATIASKNMQKDTIYIDEGTQLDYSQMDAFDTIIVKGANGGLRTFQAGESQNTAFTSPLLQGLGVAYNPNPGAVQMNVASLFGSQYQQAPIGRVISQGQTYQSAYMNGAMTIAPQDTYSPTNAYPPPPPVNLATQPRYQYNGPVVMPPVAMYAANLYVPQAPPPPMPPPAYNMVSDADMQAFASMFQTMDVSTLGNEEASLLALLLLSMEAPATMTGMLPEITDPASELSYW